MNTQILETAFATITGILLVSLIYIISRIILYFTLKKTRDEIDMLYDLLDERDENLNRYHRMFGPLKDWEDSEQAQNSLFGEEDNVKGEYLTPQQIEERYNRTGPNEDEELPF